jgi:hypothetical protein
MFQLRAARIDAAALRAVHSSQAALCGGGTEWHDYASEFVLRMASGLT